MPSTSTPRDCSPVLLWLQAAVRPLKARRQIRALSDSRSTAAFLPPPSLTNHRHSYPPATSTRYESLRKPRTRSRRLPKATGYHSCSTPETTSTPSSSAVSDSSQYLDIIQPGMSGRPRERRPNGEPRDPGVPERPRRERKRDEIPTVAVQAEINLYEAADSLRRRNVTVTFPPLDRQSHPGQTATGTANTSRSELHSHNIDPHPSLLLNPYDPAQLDLCLTTVRNHGAGVTFHPHRPSRSPSPTSTYPCTVCRDRFYTERELEDHTSQLETYCGRCGQFYACNRRLVEHHDTCEAREARPRTRGG